LTGVRGLLEIAPRSEGGVQTLKRAIAIAVLASLCGTNAFSDEAGLTPGRAAGTAAATAPVADTQIANAPLAPGKASGVYEAQNIGQAPLLAIGLGGVLVAGALLALSGGGGGGAVTPMRNMTMTTTTTTTP
jgi:hypothetical protein